VNARVTGDAANEPTMAIDPSTGRIVVGWRQFDDVNCDYRKAGYGVSVNGGITWTQGVLDDQYRSDPVVVFHDGTFRYLTLMIHWPDYWTDLWELSDGVSWVGPFATYGGDKPWMAIDPTNGNIYMAWTSGSSNCAPGYFTASYDNGATWTDCVDLPGNPYCGNMDIAVDGTVYIPGWERVLVWSHDVQYSTGTPTWSCSEVPVSGPFIMKKADSPNPAGLMGQPYIACDPDDPMTLWFLGSVDPSGRDDPMDVHVCRSEDGGLTWGPPIRINDDAPGAWQWFGTLDVAENGRLDAVWFDTRQEGGYISRMYWACSWDRGETWSPNRCLSEPFDPHVGWPVQQKIGDYMALISSNEAFEVVFPATFKGEQDLYYMRVRLPTSQDEEAEAR
jgi:hypothetical protein